jgi:spermidine synthase
VSAASGGPPTDPTGPPEPGLLGRAHDAHGEIVLRRRDDVLELVVDGVFAMDSSQTSSEEALATLALARLAGRDLHVLVGGLGLGFTTSTLLADQRVGRVEVVELHPALVEWVAAGLVPSAKGVLEDRRLTVHVADVLDVVPALPRGRLDALLLDVDNGPGFLTHPGNTTVYTPPFLAAAARAVRRGGVLGVWSAEPATELAVALERACGECEEILLDVSRDGRTFTYAVYLARIVR